MDTEIPKRPLPEPGSSRAAGQVTSCATGSLTLAPHLAHLDAVAGAVLTVGGGPWGVTV